MFQLFPVKQYHEAKLEMILNIFNNGTTYIGAGETNGFQYVYVFIAICATSVLDPPEATGDRMGSTGTLILISFLF